MNTKSTKTEIILKILHVIFWIIFIGLCIKTGTVIYSAFISLAINPEGAENLYSGLNMSDLMDYGILHYSVMLVLIILVSALKAYIAYLAVKIFVDFSITHPFSQKVASIITKISYVALTTGIISIIAYAYYEWLKNEDLAFTYLHEHLGGNGEFLFLAGVIFIIAQVFNKGIEIQSENELTV